MPYGMSVTLRPFGSVKLSEAGTTNGLGVPVDGIWLGKSDWAAAGMAAARQKAAAAEAMVRRIISWLPCRRGRPRRVR